MNAPITVVLVEDHALTRTGLRTALEASGDVRVVAEASDGISAEGVIVREAPAVAIIDIGLPGRDGVALTRAVKTAAPQTHVVIAGGGAYFDPRIAHVVLRRLGAPSPQPSSDSPLTPRELDVLRLIADGIGNQEIGERLHIGLGTVKGHIRDILEKLSAADRTQAAVNAMRRGYL